MSIAERDTADSKTVTRSPFTPLTDMQRQAIAAAIGAGLNQTQVAEQFGVCRMTVWRIVRDLRRATRELNGDWRTGQTQKAVMAVNRALESQEDVYKAGTIGVAALKGLGVYAAETTNNVTVVYSSLGGATSVFDAVAHEVDTDLAGLSGNETDHNI